MVYSLVFARGTINAVDFPTRQSFAIEMVGAERVVNAVSLNSVRIVNAASGLQVPGQILFFQTGSGPSLASTSRIDYVASAPFGVGTTFEIVLTSARPGAGPRERVTAEKRREEENLFAAFFVALTQAVEFTGADTLRGTRREFEAIIAAVIGAVIAEFVGARQGLGFLIVISGGFARTDIAFAAITLLGVMSVVLFYALVALERWLVPWSEERTQPL